MSSPARRRIDEIGEESRRRILDAAEELFAERGFDRTSFVDISEKSGISRGSIPWHFKNKDGLVMAVIERAIDRVAGPAHYETVPTLRQVFDDYGSWLRTGTSSLLFMILTEAMRSTGAIRSQYQEFMAKRRHNVELWLRSQRPAGIDPELARQRELAMAASLNGAVLGIHLQYVLEADSFDLDGALQALASFIDAHVADVWA